MWFSDQQYNIKYFVLCLAFTIVREELRTTDDAGCISRSSCRNIVMKNGLQVMLLYLQYCQAQCVALTDRDKWIKGHVNLPALSQAQCVALTGHDKWIKGHVNLPALSQAQCVSLTPCGWHSTCSASGSSYVTKSPLQQEVLFHCLLLEYNRWFHFSSIFGEEGN
jgi:hypothetical protein